MRYVLWEIVIAALAWSAVMASVHSIVETNQHAEQRQEMVK
jgi:hypothetical protein